MTQIREEVDIRPILNTGIWGDRLRRTIVDDFRRKYGQVINLRFRQHYPYVSITGMRGEEAG